MPKTLDQVPSLSAEERAILAEFAAGVRERLGERVRRIELFGSRARGDAGEESDYDVLVVLDRADYDAVSEVGGPAFDALLYKDVFIVPIIIAENQWADHRAGNSFLSRDIIAEGVTL